MKKMNKKGFTIVELVIVIAVIAVLAGVMIPTFSGVLETAQKSAATQQATAAYKDAYAVVLSNDGKITNGETADSDIFRFTWTVTEDSTTCDVKILADKASDFGYTITVDVATGVITATKAVSTNTFTTTAAA